MPSRPQQCPRIAPAAARNLYVREDELLIELVQRLEVDGDNFAPRALDVVAHLRARSKVIVHDRTGWKVAARGDDV